MKLNFFFIFLFLSKDRQELKKKKAISSPGDYSGIQELIQNVIPDLYES